MRRERRISSRILCKPIITTQSCQIILLVWLGQPEISCLNCVAFEEMEKPNDTSKDACALCSCDPDSWDVRPIIVLSKVGACAWLCVFAWVCRYEPSFVRPTEVVALIKARGGCKTHRSQVHRSFLTLLNHLKPLTNVTERQHVLAHMWMVFGLVTVKLFHWKKRKTICTEIS